VSNILNALEIHRESQVVRNVNVSELMEPIRSLVNRLTIAHTTRRHFCDNQTLHFHITGSIRDAIYLLWPQNWQHAVIAMLSSKAYIFIALQAVLLALIFYHTSSNMDTTSPPRIRSWADQPCALITTPQYATKKVCSQRQMPHGPWS
jgi:hypothetical protein